MITGGQAKKTPWILTSIHVVQGIDMITLHKNDTGFARFVSGSTGGIRNMTFIDELRKLRMQATVDACNGGLFSGVHSNPKAKKAQKQEWETAGVPELVEITLPSAEGRPSVTIKTAGTLDHRANPVVELSTIALDHIAACMRSSFTEGHASREKVGQGVRWVAARGAYVAKKHNNGKRMRTFRASADASDEELAKADAKQRALNWAADPAEDDGDDDDEERADDDDNEKGSGDEKGDAGDSTCNM